MTPGGQPTGPARRGTLEPGSSAEEFEEPLEVKVARLERLLADQRRFARRMGRQLHTRLRRELKEAEQRARAADRRADRAEQQLRAARSRAEAAEAELARVRESPTWRAGRAVLAVPRRLRDLPRGR